MTMKEFLSNKYNGKIPVSEDDPEGSPHSNSAEVQEYLAVEKDDPDLSGVDFDHEVEICGKKFNSFTADLCDFHEGLSLMKCKISGNLSFYMTYVRGVLNLSNVKVGGNFAYPQNLPDLIDSNTVHITCLSVSGATEFIGM